MKSKAELQVIEMIKSDSPKVRKMALALLDPERTMESMLRAWHEGMGAPVRDVPTEIPPEDVVRRLRLTLEETTEIVVATGHRYISKKTGEDITNDIMVSPLVVTKENPIETIDGIGDSLVVLLGHAVEAGYPITAVFDEIMWSNCTKLPVDGNTIFNRCITGDTNPDHDCSAHGSDCVLLDPSSPVNKILKPETYVKADIKSVLDRCVQEDKC